MCKYCQILNHNSDVFVECLNEHIQDEHPNVKGEFVTFNIQNHEGKTIRQTGVDAKDQDSFFEMNHIFQERLVGRNN